MTKLHLFSAWLSDAEEQPHSWRKSYVHYLGRKSNRGRPVNLLEKVSWLEINKRINTIIFLLNIWIASSRALFPGETGWLASRRGVRPRARVATTRATRGRNRSAESTVEPLRARRPKLTLDTVSWRQMRLRYNERRVNKDSEARSLFEVGRQEFSWRDGRKYQSR